jgi:hypothetical protein
MILATVPAGAVQATKVNSDLYRRTPDVHLGICTVVQRKYGNQLRLLGIASLVQGAGSSESS